MNKWLSLMLVVLIVGIAACGGGQGSEEDKHNESGQRLCPFNLVVQIRDHQENLVFSQNYKTGVAISEKEEGAYPNGVRLENIINIEDIRTEVDAVREVYNQVYALFVGSSERLVYGVPPLPKTYRLARPYRNGLLQSTGCMGEYDFQNHTLVLHVQAQNARPTEDEMGYILNGSVTHIGNGFNFASADDYEEYWDKVADGEILPEPQYSVDYSTSESLTYVTVKTPAGSLVTYSFPSQAMADALTSVSNGEEYTLPVINFPPPSEEDGFSEAVKDDAFGGIANGQEVLTFSFVSTDLEGRQELQPFLVTALNVAASTQTQGENPLLIIRGYDVTGQIETSQMSFQTSSRGGLFYRSNSVSYAQTTWSRPVLLVSGSFWVVSPEIENE